MDGLPKYYRRVELSAKGPVLKRYDLAGAVGQNALIVRPLLMGICRSDLKEMKSARPVRRDFGHELIGVVEWSGGALPLRRGELVTYDPHVSIERTSGFGELLVAVSNARDLRLAFPQVSGRVPLRKLVMCEPLACAAHCVFRLCGLLSTRWLGGVNIAVVGAGNAGTFIALLVKHLGGTVTLFNRNARRLDFLQQRALFGAKELKRFGKARPQTFDVVIPTTSFLFPEVLDLSLEIVRGAGTLLLFGGTHEGTSFPGVRLRVDDLRRKELTKDISWKGKQVKVAGTHGAKPQDFAAVISYLSDYPEAFPVERLIVEEISLEALPPTLQRLSIDEEGYVGKVIVTS